MRVKSNYDYPTADSDLSGSRQPGLYKIEKIYAEGNKEEDVIFKLGE
ncbi:MAG: hypothetical protein WBA61_09195 [Aequorivita sp.]